MRNQTSEWWGLTGTRVQITLVLPVSLKPSDTVEKAQHGTTSHRNSVVQ